MKRNVDEGTWEFEPRQGLVVMAYRTGRPDEHVLAQMFIEEHEGGIRLRVGRYEHNLTGGPPSPPPLEQIEAFANQPTNAVFLIQTMDAPAAGTLPRFLPGVRVPGRKPNDFYGWVLIHKRACEERGDSYAHRIARDNNVTPNVVYRWVQEAKRRGISIDDDEVGQVRINGVPMGVAGEPMPDMTGELLKAGAL